MVTKSIVEDAALTWFGELVYAVGHGLQLVPGEPAAERGGCGGAVLLGRLQDTVGRSRIATGWARRHPAPLR